MLALCLVSLGLQAVSLRGQELEREAAVVSDPNATATVKALDKIVKNLSTHANDLTVLMKATSSPQAKADLLWLLSVDADYAAVLSALRDEASAWSVLDNASRARVQPAFENTRAHIQDDLETAIPIVSQTTASITAPRAAVEAAQNKGDLRKIRDWVAAFRFRMTDPRYGQAP